MNKNSDIDLIALIEKDLGQGRKSGRWVKFHCPFPGHTRGDKKPSLSVTMGDGTRLPGWKCFTCGKSGDAIAWVMQYRGVNFKEALKILNVKNPEPFQKLRHDPIQRHENPPDEMWQIRAMELIEHAERALWDIRGVCMLAWLRKRGLHDDTIRAARLGYIPKDYRVKPEVWGTPNNDAGPMYFYEGLLIPGVIGTKVWYLKMRPSHPRGNMPKYINVRGGKSCALYGADLVADGRPAVFCEGELDTLLLRQEAKDLASAMTLGSATNKLYLPTWDLYLFRPSSFLIAYDADAAGKKGGDDLTWLQDSMRLYIPILRDGDKDLTDFHKSGGNLLSLIESALRKDAPIIVNWLADTKPATIRGQYWETPDCGIEAYYLPTELSLCLEAMKAISEPGLAQA